MWSFMNAASTGLVLKPETKQVQGPLLPGAMSRWWARRISASSCRLPPSPQPSESYQKSLAFWTAAGLRCSYLSAQAHSARVCERYLRFSAGPLAILGLPERLTTDGTDNTDRKQHK